MGPSVAFYSGRWLLSFDWTATWEFNIKRDISPLQIYFSIRSLLKPKEAKMIQISEMQFWNIFTLCLFSRGVVALEYGKSNNYQVYYSWTRNCQRLSFCLPRSVFSSIKKNIYIYCIYTTSRLLKIFLLLPITLVSIWYVLFKTYNHKF